MSGEAEKLINLSLCKMATSRSFRESGSILHKHLLIASVLTKARSAYFENWPGSDENGEDVGDDDDAISSYDNNNSKGMEMGDEDVPVMDPRVFVQVESEIELPADILNCVEKLGSLGGVDFFHNNLSASVVDDVEIQDEFSHKSAAAAEQRVVEKDVVVDEVNDVQVEVDLDLSSQELALSSDGKHQQTHQHQRTTAASSPMPNKASDKSCYGLPASQQDNNNYYNRSNFKRRRGSDSSHMSDQENITNDLSVSNLAKRLRISNAANVIQESGSRLSTKDAEWEENESVKHDRRVPSNNSSSSSNSSNSSNNSSDEENDQPESTMEVDQITSLVQYFSFSHQQQQQQQAPQSESKSSSVTSSCSSSSSPAAVGPRPSSSSSSSTSSSSSNLIRSVSSPDLCNNHRCVIVTT